MGIHKKNLLKSKKICNICNHNRLHKLWYLPNYPLTEQFGKFKKNFPNFKQKLVICKSCGHVQLSYILNQSFLYNPTDYKYRTQRNDKDKSLSIFFIEFLKENIRANPNQILDVGGNDGFILENIFKDVNKIVVDPVSQSKNKKKIKFYKKFVNQINLKKHFGLIDCVICRHTLEHIPNPVSFIKHLFRNTSENCNFIFEVPSYKHMVKKSRFDTIMHQHINYFDKLSLIKLMSVTGGRLYSLKYLENGPCGGSILFYFKKSKNKSYEKPVEYIEKKIEKFEISQNSFLNKCRKINKKINKSNNVIGYGAGLMLSTYFYYLKIYKLCFIIDDDPKKNNQSYKNINVKIKNPVYLKNLSQYQYLITSLENYNVIKEKIIKKIKSKVIN